MTIARTLLARGYFPKELPPRFFTDQFARYASTRAGRSTLAGYRPHNSETQYGRYYLALPGFTRRELGLMHPATFTALVRIVAKSMRRLLKKAGASSFSKSRPVYEVGRHRALHTLIKPSNLAREKASARAGGSYLVKADVSHFYPALYTHAVGWAVDPRTRHGPDRRNMRLLGKQLDQALMNMQGKISQGVPIGNDVSFLLSEAVLSQVDKALKPVSGRGVRWFDDYEITCDTSEEAERVLDRLRRELARFNLRLNPMKTDIIKLPEAVQPSWQQSIAILGSRSLNNVRDILHFFDSAFTLRETEPNSPVLMYALGTLFGIRQPYPDVARVAQSAISQAVLREPGAAQKAFALLTFWKLNGTTLDAALWSRTISHLVVRHAAGGVTSDVAWGLSFCLDCGLSLSKDAARVLAHTEDDTIQLQALDMHSQGLLPVGFSPAAVSRLLSSVDMDGEHWLVAYEAVRHGFLSSSESIVRSNDLFRELLAKQVTFYRRRVPSYAMVVHPGGAPEWIVNRWLGQLAGTSPFDGDMWPVLELIRSDLESIEELPTSHDDIVETLLNTLSPWQLDDELDEGVPYPGR